MASDGEGLGLILATGMSDAAAIVALMFMLGGFIVFMGLLLLIPEVTVFGPERRKREALRERGVATTARVVKIERRLDFPWQHITTVEWVDSHGTTRQHREIWRPSRAGEGDEMDLMYDPQKLSRVQVFDERGPRFSMPWHETFWIPLAKVMIPLGLVILAAALAAALATSTLDELIDSMMTPE